MFPRTPEVFWLTPTKCVGRRWTALPAPVNTYQRPTVDSQRIAFTFDSTMPNRGANF
jgi:hypothetical protein